MISECEAKELIDDLFEEQALTLGGLVALHPASDDFIWGLCRNLEVIRKRTLRQLDSKPPSGEEETWGERPLVKPHPAIEEFLLSLHSSERMK